MPYFGLGTVTEVSDLLWEMDMHFLVNTAMCVVAFTVKQDHKARHSNGKALQ